MRIEKGLTVSYQVCKLKEIFFAKAGSNPSLLLTIKQGNPTSKTVPQSTKNKLKKISPPNVGVNLPKDGEFISVQFAN